METRRYIYDKGTGELLMVLGAFQLSSRVEGSEIVMTATYPVLWRRTRSPEPEEIEPTPLEQCLNP